MIFNKADRLKAVELAYKYGIDVEDVMLIISEPYEFIRAKSKELIIKDNLTKEEFDKLKTNFNLPAIGKLYSSHFLYEKIQKNKVKKNLE